MHTLKTNPQATQEIETHTRNCYLSLKLKTLPFPQLCISYLQCRKNTKNF